MKGVNGVPVVVAELVVIGLVGDGVILAMDSVTVGVCVWVGEAPAEAVNVGSIWFVEPGAGP